MPEHTPAPTPSRGVYGFVLYLASYTALILYLIWAFVPDEYLHLMGLTYWPMKYWAITLPVYGCMLLAIFAFLFYPGVNLMMVPPLDDLRTITDSYARSSDDRYIAPGGIPPAADLPLTEVCEILYLRQDRLNVGNDNGFIWKPSNDSGNPNYSNVENPMPGKKFVDTFALKCTVEERKSWDRSKIVERFITGKLVVVMIFPRYCNTFHNDL